MKSGNNKKFSKTKPVETTVEGGVENKNTIRLNKFIANAGVCSRREADKLITSEKIKVNGKVITEMGFQVSNSDEVIYNGKKLSAEKFVYILLNKPKGFVTTTKDPHAERTVMDLVKNATDERIYPVGRLDKETTGLLILTNDGELTQKLTHPSNNISKIYKATLHKPLTREDQIKLVEGVELEDGKSHFDELSILPEDKKEVGVELHSGKNRVIRRMFEHLDYHVRKLDRVTFAGLTKKDLPRGKYRMLTDKEVFNLKKSRKERSQIQK